jgi:diketogulonate reductase-like aldo/keto reductase
MTRAPLVQANGTAIPALGLGTWQLKGDACAEAVRHGLALGYRHLDTAAMYGNEQAVGEGLRASGLPRDEVFVTTKIWLTDLEDGPLQASAKASLRRLDLDVVDLLLIHWPNPEIPLNRAIPALCDAKRRGLARHVGVSNFTAALMDEAVGLASEPLITNQCEYHPYLDQGPVLAACRRHGLAFTSYSPLGQGALLQEPVVGEIARAHGATPGQVILRWHVGQPGVVAIPKSGNPARIEENLGALDLTLTDEEMARLHSLAKPDGRMISPDFAPDWDRTA